MNGQMLAQPKTHGASGTMRPASTRSFENVAINLRKKGRGNRGTAELNKRGQVVVVEAWKPATFFSGKAMIGHLAAKTQFWPKIRSELGIVKRNSMLMHKV
jgi:hypothetical protein